MQIKIIHKYKWVLLSIIVVILLMIGAYIKLTSHKTPHAQTKTAAIPVKVMTLHTQALPINEKTTGYLQAIENTTITPRVAGYIKSIPFQPGAKVKKDQVLFQLDNQKERDALASAKANYDLSKIQYLRNKKLLKEGFITQDLYYTSKVTMQQNAANLQIAQTNLAEKKIIAPFSGTIGATNTSIGDYVTPGNALTTLVDNKQLRVSYTLPAKDLTLVKLNQSVTIGSQSTNNNITGYVSFISSTVDQDTQTIVENAAFNNNPQAFKPGEFVHLSQHIADNQHALFVPEQSVLADLNGYSVYVVKNQKAVQIPVKVASRQDGKILITAGLKPTMQLIVDGQTQVHDGEKVTIQ